MQRRSEFTMKLQFYTCSAAGKIQDWIIKALNIKINSLRQKMRSLRKSVVKTFSGSDSVKNSLNCRSIKSKELLIKKEKK